MSVRAMKWAAQIMPMLTLPSPERAIIWALSYHHNDASGECFPSMETLSDWCGVADRRTREGVKTLIAWGIIKAKRGTSPSGNASNRYTLFGKPKLPRESGRRGTVSGGLEPAQKSRFENGRRGTVSNRQTGDDDRGIINGEEKAPTNIVKFGAVGVAS